MRIIIDESEIKEAIVALVKSQVSIQEGQEISVELKATRGDSGNTAEITINAPSVPVVQATPVKRTPRARTVETKTEETAQEASEEVSSTETANDTPETEEAVAETPVVEETPVQEEAKAEVSETAEAEHPVVEEAAPRTTGSLFSTLKRPVNNA